MTSCNSSKFSLTLLQAINDWQRGGDQRQKLRRGQALKEAAKEIDPIFKSIESPCYRQIALNPTYVWVAMDKLMLIETISSWTLDYATAQSFKGGIPHEAQGLLTFIFKLQPSVNQVIINLNSIYSCSSFLDAIEEQKENIKDYALGIGKYKNTQKEIVIELDSIDIGSVFALGGHSSDSEKLAAIYYGHSPSENELEKFNKLLLEANKTIGANWITGERVERVLMKGMKALKYLKPFIS